METLVIHERQKRYFERDDLANVSTRIHFCWHGEVETFPKIVNKYGHSF